MAKPTQAFKFNWTEQNRRAALLLSALGYSNRRIADYLGCSHSTVWRRLGPISARPDLSPSDLIDLFERYDAQRNIEEVIIAASGTTEQARLRASLRAKKSINNDGLGEESVPSSEELTDEQLRRAVDALVADARPAIGGV